MCNIFPKNILLISFLIFQCFLYSGNNKIQNPNENIMASIPDSEGPITKALVEAYWQKRVTNLTINQITFDRCPEVEVIVSILDDQGNPIAGLTASDFQLREDGQVLPVSVRPSDSGLGSEVSLAICIDISSSLSGNDLENEKDAAIQLVNLLGNSDEVAIYVFGTGVRLIQDFTNDKTVAINAIRAILGGGATSLYDGVAAALDNTALQNGRKAVVVMTDGADNSSINNFQSVVALAQNSNIPLFSIGFGNANAMVLEDMANQTGGVFFPSATSTDLLTILDRIGNLLGQQYILSYRTSFPDGDSHNVSVEAVIGGEVIGDDRAYNGCVFQPIPAAPTFITENNFYVDGSGNLICVFPDPNSDGSNFDGLPNYGYRVFIQVNCQIVAGPLEVALADSQDTWPQILTLSSSDLPDQDYTISVSRSFDNASTGDTPNIDIQGPTASVSTTIPTSFRNYRRWLLHVPKLASGFESHVRLQNETPLIADVALAGFDDGGNLLKIVPVSVPAQSNLYRSLYDPDLFGAFVDKVSHVGIFESAPLTELWLQYRHTSSDFVSWSQEISLDNGAVTGSVLALEARQSDRYIDGAVILNLSGSQTLDVWAVQKRQSTGETLEDVALGSLPPGGKLRVILSQLFSFKANTVYHLETRDPNKIIQGLGLSFFGNDFFAPISLSKP